MKTMLETAKKQADAKPKQAPAPKSIDLKTALKPISAKRLDTVLEKKYGVENRELLTS